MEHICGSAFNEETMETREVITLQVGHYANFVGAHYWNSQDELFSWAQDQPEGVLLDTYDSSVIFSTLGKLVFPRMIAFDTKDSFAYVHSNEVSHDNVSSSVQQHWGGKISSYHNSAPHEPNAFHRFLSNESLTDVKCEPSSQEKSVAGSGTNDLVHGAKIRKHPFNLDDTVAMWSDFLKTYIRKDMIQELPFRKSEMGTFQNFASGGGIAGGRSSDCAISSLEREGYTDVLRHILEECNAVQGFQCFTDLNNGWSGLSVDLLREMREECKSSSFSCFPIEPIVKSNSTQTAKICSFVNRSLALHALSETCSLVAPLSENAAFKVFEGHPHVSIDSNKEYHTSAILASLLDIATSPFRFHVPASSYRMDGWVDSILSWNGHGGAAMNFANLTGSFPFPDRGITKTLLNELFTHTPFLRDKMHSFGIDTFVKASVNISSAPATVFSQLLVSRGLPLPTSELSYTFIEALKQRGCRAPSASAFKTPLAIPLSFPLIFKPSIDEFGQDCGESSSQEDERRLVGEVAGIVGLENSCKIGPILREAAEKGLRVESNVVMREIERNGLHRDDAIEIRESLRKLARAYEQ